jgi:UDP-N-acetylglucosamine acyltransferase
VLAIDPTARVAPSAVIGAGVKIGPYCVIGPNVAIGDGCELVAQVHITGHTSIGAGTVIYPFASLGTPPQSVKYRGGPTRLVVGEKCRIHEGVTMNTGTEDGGGITTVGDDCFFMVGTHVAHDCHVGSHVVFANNAVIGGHVEIGDHCFLGGHCVVLQRIKIGESAMIAGNSSTREDVIPFGYVLYATARLAGVNLVGMKRRGIPRPAIHAVRHAYRDLFDSTEGLFADRIARVDAEYGSFAEVAKIVAFLRASKKPMQAKPRGNNPDITD